MNCYLSVLIVLIVIEHSLQYRICYFSVGCYLGAYVLDIRRSFGKSWWLRRGSCGEGNTGPGIGTAESVFSCELTCFFSETVLRFFTVPRPWGSDFKVYFWFPGRVSKPPNPRWRGSVSLYCVFRSWFINFHIFQSLSVAENCHWGKKWREWEDFFPCFLKPSVTSKTQTYCRPGHFDP